MRMIKLTTALAAVAALTFVAPHFASAQAPPPPPGSGPGGPPPPPGMGGPHWGKPLGLTFGFDLSLGGMTSKQVGSIDCIDCDFQPISGGFGAWIGVQLSPQLALIGDFRTTGQLIQSDFFTDSYLFQSTLMASLKYWVAPRLWIQAGIGFANVSVTVDDGYLASDETLDNGGAVMFAAGYEIAASRFMSIDLNLRVVNAAYDGLGDNIQSVMVGVGFNWFSRRGMYRRYY